MSGLACKHSSKSTAFRNRERRATAPDSCELRHWLRNRSERHHHRSSEVFADLTQINFPIVRADPFDHDEL